MSPRPIPTGKLPPDLLDRILGGFDPLPPEVRLGPRIGEDACAIDVEAGTLVAATDPITFTGAGVGAHAVLINANDVAVTGVAPRWFLCSVLLPRGTTAEEVIALFDGMRAALRSVGAALVGGHTEVTAAVTQPVVVGQMLGFAERGGTVSTGGLGAGDRLVQIGPAPVEGAALLASDPRVDLTAVPPALVEAARRGLESPGIVVVEPALLAARLGATALHDPTESGLAGALHEMAHASGTAIVVDAGAIVWFEPALAICEALAIDPRGLLASGTVLAGFRAETAGAACEALRAGGYQAEIVGEVRAGAGVRDADGAPVPRFDRDELARVLGD